MPDFIETKLNVESRYVNRDRVLRTSVLFQLMQELTVKATEDIGVTRNFTLDRGLLWIIAKQAFSVRRMPSYDETLTFRLYILPTMHIFFPRYFEVYSEGITRYEDPSLNSPLSDDEPIIWGSSLWLLMDEQDRSMVFPDKVGIEIEGRPAPARCVLPKSVSIPSDTSDTEILLSGEKEITAPWSFSDMNGHLNNSRYFDLTDDIIPHEEHEALSPKGFEADYINEVLPGDELIIEYKKTAEAWYFRGTLSEKVKPAFRIKISI